MSKSAEAKNVVPIVLVCVGAVVAMPLMCCGGGAVLSMLGSNGNTMPNTDVAAVADPTPEPAPIETPAEPPAPSLPATPVGPQEITYTEAIVQVHIHDDTKSKPLATTARISFTPANRNARDWTFRDDLVSGIGRKSFGPFEHGVEYKIVITPDGPVGRVYRIPFTTTKEMSPYGSHGDAIMIIIADDSVTVLGRPIKAAGGEAEVKEKR